MKLTIALLATLLLSLSLQAQAYYGSPQEIKALSQRKLLVLTESIPLNQRAKLLRDSNQTQLQQIEKLYQDFNYALKSAVEQRWQTPQQVIYQSRDEFEQMPDADRKQFLVLYFMTKRVASKSAGFMPLWRTILWPEPEPGLVHFNFSTMFQVCNIDRAENLATAENRLFSFPVHSISLPEVFPTVVSVNYAIAALNHHFVRCNNGTPKSGSKQLLPKNRSELSQKTLLIRRDWLVKEADINRLKEIYPYQLRLVDADDLAAALATGAPQYVWYAATPEFDSDTQNRALRFRYQILDTENGNVLGTYFPPMGYIPNKYTWTVPAGKGKMTLKTLKRLVRSFGKEKASNEMER